MRLGTAYRFDWVRHIEGKVWQRPALRRQKMRKKVLTSLYLRPLIAIDPSGSFASVHKYFLLRKIENRVFEIQTSRVCHKKKKKSR